MGQLRMFEFDQHEPRLRAAESAELRGPCPPSQPARRLSLLAWSEHCIECAAPDCFATCDLYRPRPDHQCRRFAYGIAPNRAFATPRGVAAEITFKKWGKL